MFRSFLRIMCLILSLTAWPTLADAEQGDVSTNPQQLYQHVLERAKAGSTEFQLVLGELLEKGIGTQKDVEEAFFWYSEAAKGGHLDAQARLAIMYLEGKGVAQDMPRAVELLRQAADKGNPRAIVHLGLVHVWGTDVTKDIELGLQMLVLSSEKGNGAAAYELARIHSFGRHVPEDKVAAQKWFQVSAEQGFPSGQYAYAREYVTDPDEQLRLIFLAAQGGHWLAQYDIGQFYLHRSEDPADREQAITWFRLAAMNGNEMGNQALFRLGLPDVNGNMPINTTIPSTAMRDSDPQDDLVGLLLVLGASAVVLSALDGGDGTSNGDPSSDGPLCNYGEIDMGGYCAPPSCGYGEYDAGGFCVPYPDAIMGGN